MWLAHILLLGELGNTHFKRCWSYLSIAPPPQCLGGGTFSPNFNCSQNSFFDLRWYIYVIWDVFEENLASFHARFSFYGSLTFWKSKNSPKITSKIDFLLKSQKKDFQYKNGIFGQKWSQMYCLVELKWNNALEQWTRSHFLPQNRRIWGYFLNISQDLAGPQCFQYFNAKYSKFI